MTGNGSLLLAPTATIEPAPPSTIALAVVACSALLCLLGLGASALRTDLAWRMADLREVRVSSTVPGLAGAAGGDFVAALQSEMPAEQRPFRLVLAIPRAAEPGQTVSAEVTVPSTTEGGSCLSLLTYAAPAPQANTLATHVVARWRIDGSPVASRALDHESRGEAWTTQLPAGTQARVTLEVEAAPAAADDTEAPPVIVGFEYLRGVACTT